MRGPAGHFEAAGAAALKAVAAGVPEAPLEHAKLLWAMDKPHRAIVDMEQVPAASAQDRPAPDAGT